MQILQMGRIVLILQTSTAQQIKNNSHNTNNN